MISPHWWQIFSPCAFLGAGLLDISDFIAWFVSPAPLFPAPLLVLMGMLGQIRNCCRDWERIFPKFYFYPNLRYWVTTANWFLRLSSQEKPSFHCLCVIIWHGILWMRWMGYHYLRIISDQLVCKHGKIELSENMFVKLKSEQAWSKRIKCGGQLSCSIYDRIALHHKCDEPTIFAPKRP